MKIQYFEDTDTLYIVFNSNSPVETRDLDENTLLDFDSNGQLCSMTLEHAKERVGIPEVETFNVRVSPR
ncbi:MAG: DUF2283 domain-containing protein [Thermostichus sp. HHBFW_bins_43]